MPKRLYNLVFALFLALVSATSANAQPEDLPAFNCGALVRALGLGNPSSSAGDVSVELQLPSVQSIDDPIDVIELLDGDLPLMARSDYVDLPSAWGSYRGYICTLMLVQFATNDNWPESQRGQIANIVFSNTAESSTIIPVLFLRYYHSRDQETRYYNYWRDRLYRISVITPVSRDIAVDLTSGNVGSIPYFGRDGGWAPETVRFVQGNDLPQDIANFVSENGAENARAIMVVCGELSCDDAAAVILQSLEDGAGAGTETAPATETAVDEPLPGQWVLLHVRLAMLGDNGPELPQISDLACILSAIDPEIFENPPDCASSASTGERDVAIRIAGDRQWLIVPRMAHSDLEQVVVTLPPGQPSERCALDLEYITPTNELVQIPLNPQRGSAPARFAATIDTPLPREAEGNRVYFRIMVSSEAQCGGPTREVVASAGSLMEVPLVPAGRERRAIMHVMAVNGESLDRDIGLDQINRDDFGRMILGALQAAHARVAATQSDRPWALEGAVVVRLEGAERIVPLGELDSSELRQPLAFSAIASEGSTVARSRAVLMPENFSSALRPRVQHIGTLDIDHLTITLIAPPPLRDGTVLAHPCSDPRYLTLADDLQVDGGPLVDVVVFPLLRLSEEDHPDLLNLRPLGFDPQAPSLPGGLYSCRDTPAGLQIYPFFVEPWRASVDIAPRYATALSNRLALLLENLIPQGDPIR